MPATYTREDLSVRVEAERGHVAISTNSGASWHAFSPDEARRMAAGLCVAAERVDEQDTEAEGAAA